MVKDSQTELPIEGASVEGIYSSRKPFHLNFDMGSIKTTTDINGLFTIAIPRNPCYLWVEKDGYDALKFKLGKWVGKPLKLVRWDPKEPIVIKLKKWQE